MFKIWELLIYMTGILFLLLSKIIFQLTALVMFTLLVCLFLGLSMMNFWMPMIFIMIMVGGLMVVFSYMVSMVPNQSMSRLNMKMFILMVPSLIILKPSLSYSLCWTEWGTGSMIMLYFLLIVFLLMLFVIDKLLKLEKGSLRSS